MKKLTLPRLFRSRWLKALRSGRYKQGTGALHQPRSNRYCCLGVAARECGVSKQDLDGHSNINDLVESGAIEKTSILARALTLFSKPCHKSSLRTNFVDDLIVMNDGQTGHRSNFCQIADHIEQNTRPV